MDKIYTGTEIAKYVKRISRKGMEPDYFISKYIMPSEFIRANVKLADLLRDEDFAEFYQYQRKDKRERVGKKTGQRIVVFNGEVLDGYHRASAMLNAGKIEIKAYVNKKL